MLNFASFIKAIKPYANNIGISDDEFVTNLFDYISEDLKIVVKRTKEKKPYYITKSKISLLLNQKEDISSTIREPFCKPSAIKKLVGALPPFFDDFLNKSRLNSLDETLRELLKSDYSIDNDVKEKYMQQQGVELFALVFIEAIKANNLVTHKEKELWHCGNNYIKLISGDLINIAFDINDEQRKIIVIPVNTAFDTKLSTNSEEDLFPLVSETTIHGQWLIRILPIIAKEELDKRIHSHLQKAGVLPTDTSCGLGGKSEKYPIGTTAIIQHENTIFYLLAVSDFDDKNIARSSKQFIENAVGNLLGYYDQLGMGYQIYLPLLGTGKSRAYLTPKESLTLIVDTFVGNQHKINGHINIVVLENTIAELS